jgi:small-conductance mechanosensitive channel
MDLLEGLGKDIQYIIKAVIILVTATFLVRFFRLLLGRLVDRQSRFLKVDPTRYAFFKYVLTFFIYMIAVIVIFMMVPSLRKFGYTLFASAGILTVIVGFASQQAFSNIVSGTFIVVFKPFRVGDFIEVGGYSGMVEDITLRHTVIRNFEYRRVVIPNSVISNETVLNSNLVEEDVRGHFEVGISYDSSIDLAMKIIAEEALNHPNCIDKRTKKEKKDGEPQVLIKVIELGEYSITIRAWVWTKGPMEFFDLKTDLYKSVKARFDKEGIEIPFPYRTLVYKKDLEPNG